MRRLLSIAMATALLLPAATSLAQEDKRAKTLGELLQIVREGRRATNAENARREREFRAEKSKQQGLLNNAKAALRREEQRSVELEDRFQTNEKELLVAEEQLRERLGELGELFGLVRQVAGDTREQLRASITSAELPGRYEKLEKLASSRKLPKSAELRELWLTMFEEIAASGKTSRFQANVVNAEGVSEPRDVVRIGPFSAVSEDGYLTWNVPEDGAPHLQDLARQPGGRHTGTIGNLFEGSTGLVPFSVDPSRGAILKVLIETPTALERIGQGKLIGYIIIGGGLLAVALALIQWTRLFFIERSVTAAIASGSSATDNPLGRVLAAYEENPSVDVETLERKLDDAVLKEMPALERFQATIKVAGAVAPLLGLLGTVTGMITTFQAIVLFGTGDPKTMAGGISEALVTTMLGLIAAIPLVLLHSFVTDRSRAITQVLDEQSAGIIAQHSEGERTA